MTDEPNWKRCGGGPTHPDGHAVTKYATLYGLPDAPAHGVLGVCRGCCLARARAVVADRGRADWWAVKALLDEVKAWEANFNEESRYASAMAADADYERGR